MSDTTDTGAGSGDGGNADGGTATGTQTPEGFVPRTELETEQARARDFQARADRATAELNALKAAAPAPATGGEGKDKGFDPDAFRSQLLGDVVGVTRLATAVADLKVAYPHADPAIYDRLAEFGNPDALRIAVEDSHKRVASILDTVVADREKAIRDEYAAKIGGGGEGSGTAIQAGDPTIAQLQALSLDELDALERKNPGVTSRVLRSVE